MRQALLIAGAAVLVAACGGTSSTEHADTHSDHAHVHTADGEHVRIQHEDHVDYLHDGHLHADHDGHYDEHVIQVSGVNPVQEAPVEHAEHTHGADDADHPMVPHGDHMDYLHDGRLHFVHGDHIDDHGPVTVL
ncbi:MAG: hypothetical protein AAFX02_02310 [Pseudomonadota bacterium]